MKNKLILFLLISFNTLIAFAQNGVVKGKVSDEYGEPLVGVSISVQGTTVGTVTDLDGAYSISVSEGKILHFSYVGFDPQTVVVRGNRQDVVLRTNDKLLDDVIVVAYGTASKAGYTGSASTLKSKDIEKSQVSSVSRLLQGTASGVQSIASSGQPGSDASIYIRGVGSINASSTPLYIVDGAPYDGSLNSINPADIESINVLKDAASTALYGSRAANGLVIITTKKGVKRDKALIEARFTYGVSSRAVSDYKQVSTDDYFKLYWEALRNQQLYSNGASAADAASYASSRLVSTLGINPYGSKYPQPVGLDGNIVAGATPLWNDNWSDEYTQSAHRTEAQINISGGTDKSTYYVSLGYLDDQGIALASDFKRYTGRVNLTSELRSWLRLSANMSFIHSNQNAPKGDDSSTDNTLNMARLVPSFYPLWVRDLDTGAFLTDANGNRIIDYGDYRPSGAIPRTNHLGSSKYDFTRVSNDIASLRGALDIDLYKGLVYRGSINIDYNNSNDHEYVNPVYGEGSYDDYPGYVYKGNSRTTGFTGNNVLTYTTTINTLHNIKAMAGLEYYEYNYKTLNGSRSGFPVLGLDEPVGASQLGSFTGLLDQYKLFSYFGNVDYNFNQKYFASASIRRDGSSRFSPDSRWGTFWSVGASWRIKTETFLQDVNAIDRLTLRASYGGQGNDRIGSYYGFQDLYAISNNLGESGFVKKNLNNPDLKWETNLNLNIGLDYAFLNNRISGSFEFFNRRSKDLLFTMPKPLSVGYSGYTANIGAMKNVGYEFSITGTPIKTKNIEWSVSVNGTHYKNTVTELPQKEIVSTYTILRKGGSAYDFFLPEWAGVDPETGLAQWYKTDASGERVKTTVYNEANTTASKIVAGSSLPDLVGGFGTNFKYKDFDFSALFAYSLGGKIYDRDKLLILHNGSTAGRAWSTDILDRWTPENRETDVPRLATTNSSAWTSTSTRFLVDADYLRLKNVTLGYTVPRSLLSRIQIESCRVYLQAENLLTVFGAQGIDPEQALNGISYFRYPAMKTLSFGLNLAF